MRLNGKLEKLERKARFTLKCDWCKFSLRDLSPDEEDKVKATPGNFVKVNCPWCGTEVTYDVSRYNRRELELFLIFKNHSCDGSMYRDERVFAAHAWSLSMRELPGANAFARLATLPPDELRKVLEERFGRRPNSKRQPARPEKPNKYAQERAELKRKAGEFAARMYQEERDTHGPIRHDLGREVEALETILPENCGAGSWEIKTPESAARKLLYHARVVEKCEVRLWGRARQSIRQMIEFAAPIVQGFDDERAEKKRQQEEAKRKSEEEYQRRRAEREARLNPQAIPIPAADALVPPADRPSFPVPIQIPTEIDGHPVEQPEYDSKGRKLVTIPWIEPEKEEAKSKLPPDDGSVWYQEKLAHYRKTGIWLPDPWQRPGY